MPTGSVNEVKEKAVPILRAAGARRSAIFGSFARGEATPESDIDILVDLPDGKSLFDFVGLKLELEDTLNRPVDLVEYSTIKPRLRPSIEADQIAIL